MTEGERVKSVRKTLNLTLEKFGGKFGMSRSSISDIENGRRSLTDQTRLSICREFNVDENWLRTGKGEMFLDAPDTAMGQLAKELGLDEFMQGVVSEYLKLNEEQRQVVREFVNKIAEQPIEDPPAVPTLAVLPQPGPEPEPEPKPQDALDDTHLLDILSKDPADMTDEECALYGKAIRLQSILEKKAEEAASDSLSDTG